MTDRARILIFTGDGKGKTTAALGMALRASGHGMKVCIIQFIKADATVGEVAALADSGLIELHQTGLGFLPKTGEPKWPSHKHAAQAGLDRACAAIASGQFAVVILDELCVAVAKGLLAEADVLAVLSAAGKGMIVVLTGRSATDGLIAAADTVTEMRCVKHAYATGRAAQAGVEI